MSVRWNHSGHRWRLILLTTLPAYCQDASTSVAAGNFCRSYVSWDFVQRKSQDARFLWNKLKWRKILGVSECRNPKDIMYQAEIPKSWGKSQWMVTVVRTGALELRTFLTSYETGMWAYGLGTWSGVDPGDFVEVNPHLFEKNRDFMNGFFKYM